MLFWQNLHSWIGAILQLRRTHTNTLESKDTEPWVVEFHLHQSHCRHCHDFVDDDRRHDDCRHRCSHTMLIIVWPSSSSLSSQSSWMCFRSDCCCFYGRDLKLVGATEFDFHIHTQNAYSTNWKIWLQRFGGLRKNILELALTGSTTNEQPRLFWWLIFANIYRRIRIVLNRWWWWMNDEAQNVMCVIVVGVMMTQMKILCFVWSSQREENRAEQSCCGAKREKTFKLFKTSAAPQRSSRLKISELNLLECILVDVRSTKWTENAS